MVSGNSEAWGRLMIAGQAGDRSAYRLLLDELRLWLIRYYRHRLPADLVDDAVQEALVALHSKRHTWDPARPFVPWLAAIARYKWIDRLRHMTATRAEPLPDELPSAMPAAMITADCGDAVICATILGRLLATLSPAQEQAIRLVKLDGLSIEEAAQASGQSAALVKVNIHRGLGRLMRLVESYETETHEMELRDVE